MLNFAVSTIKVEIKSFKQHHTMQLSFNKLILWPGLAWIPWQELFTSVKEGSIALQLDCNNVAPFGLGLVFRVPIVKVLLIWKQTLRCSQGATNEFPMRDRLSTIRRGHGKSKRLKYSFRSRNPPSWSLLALIDCLEHAGQGVLVKAKPQSLSRSSNSLFEILYMCVVLLIIHVYHCNM